MTNTNIANLIEQTLAELAIEELCAYLASREPSEANVLVWALLAGV